MPHVQTLLETGRFPGLSGLFADLAETKIPLPHGYSITFENYFRPNDWEQFHGNFFILRNFDGAKVGVLEFFAWWPLQISTVQGMAGKLPQKFFMESGKNFDETLIDALLEKVHTHFPNPRPPGKPKVVFAPEALYKMKKNMRARIMRKYCPKPAIHFLINISHPGELSEHLIPWLRVKERIFSKMRKQQKRRK